MFDIGFLELLVIAVLGLLVIGPERLPGAIKSGARAIGKLKHLAGQARTEIEQQIGMDEIRQDLQNEEILKQLNELKKQTELDLEEEEEDFYGPDHHAYEHGDEHEDNNQLTDNNHKQNTTLADNPSDEKPHP